MKSNQVKRNSNIELLRFILMLMICIWHTMVYGYDLKNVGSGPVPSINNIFLMGACVPAVDVFIMISGYYGIKLSASKLFRLVFQILIITNTIIFVRFFCYNGSLSFYDQVLPISSGITLWFVSIYVVIMLLSPIINAGIDGVDSKVLGKVIVLLFFIYSIVQYRLGMEGTNLITLFLIYLLGRYLKKVRFSMSVVCSLCLWIISMIIILSLMFYQYFNGSYSRIWILLSYNNPIVIMKAMSIFFLFQSLKRTYLQDDICCFWGRHSLSIYLISEMIGCVLYIYWAQLLKSNSLIYLIAIVIFAFLCETVDIFVLKISKSLSTLTVNLLERVNVLF